MIYKRIKDKYKFNHLSNNTDVILVNNLIINRQIQSNAFEIILSSIIEKFNSKKILVLIDENLKDFFNNLLLNKFESKILKDLNINFLFLKIDEKNKDLNFIEKIYTIFFQNELDKNSFVLSIGGGVISDIIGFSASTYKRGINFGFMPTTFLSMIDACFGGKNGVNFQEVKNLIGTINQPSFIFLAPSFLNYLNDLEFFSGFAEFTKYLLLNDDLFKKFISNFSKFINKKLDKFTFNSFPLFELKSFFVNNPEFFYYSLNTKYKYLKNDIFDSNKRHILNLGHTISHGIEIQLNLTHGSALYVGMFLEIEIVNMIESNPKNKNKVNNKVLPKLKNIYEIFKLPSSINDLLKYEKNMNLKNWLLQANINYKVLIESIINKIHQDKKNIENFYTIPFFESLTKIKLKKIEFSVFDEYIFKLLNNADMI